VARQGRHPVWFERHILPDLLADVEVRAEVLGPGTEMHPFAGLEGASGAVAGSHVYAAALMDRAPDLVVIVRTGIGVEKVDIDEATRRGIAVCNTPEGPTVSTAEHAVSLILAIAKNVKRAATRLSAGETDLFSDHMAVELDGKTLGLAGYGRIARRVATAAAGLGMRVIAFDPFVDSAQFGATRQARTLEEMLGEADVVSLHMPLTSQSARSFGAEQFAAMKDGAVFVNTARGGLVDTDALLDALEVGKLMGAGLDVTDPEPLPAGHELLHRDDVIVTPHVASATFEGKRRIFGMAFSQVIQVLDGERPAHLVNPEVWERLAAQR